MVVFHVILVDKRLVLHLLNFLFECFVSGIGAGHLEADAQCQFLILLLTEFLFH